MAYQAAYLVAEKKAERDEEHEADLLGMRAAAEAGYHPDYAILAARTLRAATGEQSKFRAFFSGHPRWTTREERTERNYDAAVSFFAQKWSSVEESPGGRPPALASLSEVTITHDQGSAVLHSAVRVRNLNGQSVTLTATLVGDKGQQPVQLLESTYASDQRSPEPLTVQIPKETLKALKGKHFVQLRIRTDREVIFESQPVRVK